MNARTPAIWLSTTRREAVMLIKRLWPELSNGEKLTLLRIIVLGPPRHLYRADLPEERWDDLRNHEVFTWLAILKRVAGDGGLPPEGEQEFANLTELHPDWQLPDWQAEGFVSYSFGAGFVGQPTEISAQELLAKTPEEIVELELGKRLGASQEVWRQLATQNSSLAASVLSELAGRQKYPEDIWTGVLQAIPRFDSELLISVLKVLSGAPESLLTQVLGQVCMWLSLRSSDFTPEEEVLLWPVWDRLKVLAEKREVTGVYPDPMNVAINHPFGNLAEVLIKRFWASKPEPNQGLRALASRFTLVVNTASKSGWCGRIVIAAALHPLFVVDPVWTKDNLLPYFDWKRAKDDAALVWDGYLYSPRLAVGLLAVLKPQFLEAFRELKRLQNQANLCSLLAAVGLEGSGEITAQETREAIRAMGPKGRHELTAWIARRMRPQKQNAGSGIEEEQPEPTGRARFFLERAIPWLISVWPPEMDAVDGEVSTNVAIASIWAGDTYPKAVRELQSFWKTAKDPDMLLWNLRESKQHKQFPSETLELLYRLLDQALFSHTARELREVLHDLSNVNPKIKNDPRYSAVRDTAQRAET